MKTSDIKFRYTRGTGNGGQHKNKTDSCVYATHIPTGIEVKVDGRDQHRNKRQAIKELRKRLEERKQLQANQAKKDRRDTAIRDTKRIRTYDYSKGIVIDHRSGKRASLKDIITKGQIEKLR